MSGPQSIDGVLVQWGERLFYPGNRDDQGAVTTETPCETS